MITGGRRSRSRSDAEAQLQLIGFLCRRVAHCARRCLVASASSSAETCSPRVRIALANPDCAEVAARDQLEGLGGTLAARIRSTMQHLEPLLANRGVEARYHGVPLYNALYRFDDQMLVTPYLYRLHGYQHPLLHLKRLGPAGIFEMYAQQFEAIWAESQPVLTPTGG
jgi:hypothetical protein